MIFEKFELIFEFSKLVEKCSKVLVLLKYSKIMWVYNKYSKNMWISQYFSALKILEQNSFESFGIY